ncbi:Uncharacterised protein [Streptococcus pneumoniae]|nr:Uncharacterised protein [Streptococcus pneumoniae]
MPVEEVEHVLVQPGLVLDLHRHAHPLGQQAEEPGESVVVAVQVDRQLQQQRPGVVTEQVQGVHDALHPVLRLVELAVVGEVAGGLDGHLEAGGQALAPCLDGAVRRPAVVGAVELDRPEALRVVVELVGDPQPLRVEGPAPVPVGPAGGPDPHVHPPTIAPARVPGSCLHPPSPA